MVYDHHCPWINNCIGAQNQGVFVFFIFSLICGIGFMTYLIISLLINNDFTNDFLTSNIDAEVLDAIRIAALTIHLAIGVLFLLALLMLFYTQSVNLFSGKTTLERYIT